jgi:hypothetical protein
MDFARVTGRRSLERFLRERGIRPAPEDGDLFEVASGGRGGPRYLRLELSGEAELAEARKRAVEIRYGERNVDYLWLADEVFSAHILAATDSLAYWQFDRSAGYPPEVEKRRVRGIEKIKFGGEENRSLRRLVTRRLGAKAVARALSVPLYNSAAELRRPKEIGAYNLRILEAEDGDKILALYLERMSLDSYEFVRCPHGGETYRVHRGALEGARGAGNHAHYLRDTLEKLLAASEELGLEGEGEAWYIKYDPLGGGLYAGESSRLEEILENRGLCGECGGGMDGRFRVGKRDILFVPDASPESTDVTAYCCSGLSLTPAAPDFSELWRALAFVSGRDLLGDLAPLPADDRAELAQAYTRARGLLSELSPRGARIDDFLG